MSDEQKIENAPWLNAAPLQTILGILNDHKEQARIVGGAVRNHLLARPIQDIDIAVKHPPQTVLQLAKKAGIKAIPTGLDHGTVTLVHNQQHFEVTTLREDIKTDGRHATVAFGTSWLQDAKRRDFTINALYLSSDGRLHDPLGTGLKDIAARRVRFIGDAKTRIKEDQLRILRFYRFAAHYHKGPLDREAVATTIQQRRGLTHLSKERIQSELIKLLQALQPRPVLQTLYQTGLLQQILASAPNWALLERLLAIESTLGQAANPILRLGIIAAYHQGDINRLGVRLALSKAEQTTLRLSLAERPFAKATESGPDIKAHKKCHYQLGWASYQLAFMASWARSQQEPTSKTISDLFQTAESWPAHQFPLTGQDLIHQGVKPGPELGALLSQLEELWLEEKMTPTKQDLLNHLTTMKSKQ